MHNCHANMQPYLADLQDRLGLPVIYRRHPPRYEDEQPFRREILLFGPSPSEAAPFAVPVNGKLVEFSVPCQQLVDGEGISINHGDEPYLVAAVAGRRVNLAFDLERLFEEPGHTPPGPILQAVLEPALAKAAANIQTYDWQAETARFVMWDAHGLEMQQSLWKGNWRDNDYELERLFTSMTALVRKNGEIRELMAATASAAKPARELTAAAEFKALLKMMPEPVTAVEFDGSKLVVRLSPITLDHDGEYDMGPMTLSISDSIRIRGDGRHAYPHPHVSSDSVPCWGNLGPHIAKLLGERQYAGLIATIVEFLHSYNARDAYRHIEQWDPDWREDDDD
jgi:hypothetical protein